MPIALICGACEAKLNAPDAAAGKKVKCPKCGVMLEIPVPEAEADYEVVQDAPTMMMPPVKKAPSLPPKPAAKAPPPAAVARAKPKPAVLDEDDEDDRPMPKKKSKPVLLDDDEDERPAPKKKSKPVLLDDEDEYDDEPKPKKGKKKPAAKDNTKLLLGIGGGVFGLALVGFLVYWFALREPAVAKAPTTNPPGTPGRPQPGESGPADPFAGGPGPQPGAPPAGWVEFTGEGFVAVVPQGVQLQRNAQMEQLVAAQSPGAKVWMNTTPPVLFQVTRVKAPANEAEAFARDPDAALRNATAKDREKLPAGSRIESETAVTVGGQKGRQLVIRMPNQQLDTISRFTIRDGFIVALGATAQNLTSDSDERVKAFFEGFRFADAGPPQPKGRPGTFGK